MATCNAIIKAGLHTPALNTLLEWIKRWVSTRRCQYLYNVWIRHARRARLHHHFLLCKRWKSNRALDIKMKGYTGKSSHSLARIPMDTSRIFGISGPYTGQGTPSTHKISWPGYHQIFCRFICLLYPDQDMWCIITLAYPGQGTLIGDSLVRVHQAY